jgi:hypothetical protein
MRFAIPFVAGLACIASLSESYAASLQDEASRQAEIVWSRYAAKCGDSYVHLDTDGGEFTQFRDVKFDFMGDGSVTQVDRMNGVEWWGHIKMTAALERTSEPKYRWGFIPAGGERWGAWDDDGSYAPGFHLKKISGAWFVEPDDEVGGRIPVAELVGSKLKCSKLPSQT